VNTRQALIARVAAAENVIRETPVVRLKPSPDLTVDLYAKLEYCNGVGSIKDRPAFWILKRAIERGEIGPDTTVIESSSGNFACALSVFCRMLGLKFIPVIDPNISPIYEATLACNCETVVKVTKPDGGGGYLESRLEKVSELLNSSCHSYWPNQYKNADGMAAHYHLTGAEMENVPLDYVFLGVSTGGTIAGVSQRLKEKNPRVRIVAVDAEGSVIFGGRPKRRLLPGLGSSIHPALVQQAQIDDVVIVPEVDAISACRELLERYALFVGASTGSVYSAIRKYFRGQENRVRPRVMFLCCDKGSAYLHNVFDRSWGAWRASLERQVPAVVNE
jgi:cysteine synthase A